MKYEMKWKGNVYLTIHLWLYDIGHNGHGPLRWRARESTIITSWATLSVSSKEDLCEPSYKQHIKHHSLCCTSCGTLAGMRLGLRGLCFTIGVKLGLE